MSDTAQWIVMAIITLVLGILAWRQNPKQRLNLDSGTLKSYAEVARLATEGLEKANIRIKELEDDEKQKSEEFERRLKYLENGARYRLIAHITIGEHPIIESVVLEPLCTETQEVTKISKPQSFIKKPPKTIV